MLTANIDALAKQLEELRLEIDRKLHNMVQGWTLEITKHLIGKTPYGDFAKYQALYEARTDLEPIPGLAQGSWQVNYGSKKLDNIQIYNGEEAVSRASMKMQGYKLGFDVYIGNVAPYFMALDNGYSKQAPLGITQPTLQNIQALYSSDFKRFYK